ncbi:unnamed protein product [Alopecurus aequalis]
MRRLPRQLLSPSAARRRPPALARRAFPPAIFLVGDRFPLIGSRNLASGEPLDGIPPLHVFRRSRHRDGSIYSLQYKNQDRWERKYRVADRSETVLEATMFTEPTENCILIKGICVRHRPGHILQFLSIKVAKLHVDGGPVALYGYIAVRDNVDPLLNYIIKFSRDDPIIVEQGSFINLAGPKRGIDFCDGTLIEYDMRIKTAEEEKLDLLPPFTKGLQLIDGVSMMHGMGLQNCQPFTNRIHGDSGAVDITASLLERAVEATVEVGISEVQSSFNLSLGCFTSGMNEEIRLFDGAIGEALCLKRFVVAVELDSWIRLKLKIGPESSSFAEHGCSFNAGCHGFSSGNIKTDFALISVKVTWSRLLRGH